MRRGILTIGMVMVLGTGASAAEVNCKRVMKDLEAGRTAEDIETTSGGTITPADVKKCQEQAAEQKAGAAKGDAKAGAAGQKEQK